MLPARPGRSMAHVGLGDQLFSNMPYLRPIATITHDTLDWYGFDRFGGSVLAADPARCLRSYTHNLLSNGGQYHHCCHSNLTRAFAARTGKSLREAKAPISTIAQCLHVHRLHARHRSVVFHEGKSGSPRRYLEFFAEIDLLGCMSACPGGDCSTEHSSTPSPAIRWWSKSTSRHVLRQAGARPRSTATTAHAPGL